MEKKGEPSQTQDLEEEKKELIKTIESVKLEETKGGVVSTLITQQQDPIVAIERELGIKIEADTKDKLREITAEVPLYKDKVKTMLDFLRDKYKSNYKVMKHINNMEPLYDTHDFWDSQPVPRAYETIDESKLDQPIDEIKTVADVKPEPYTLPEGFYWVDVNVMDRVQAEEVY
jgi:hypothetical protein